MVVGLSRPRHQVSHGTVVLTVIALLSARPATARDATLSDLQPFIGRVVLIETSNEPPVVARLIRADDAALVAAVGGIETTFREREVRSVTADVDSMRIGLWMGAGFGVAAGILGAQGLSCSDC